MLADIPNFSPQELREMLAALLLSQKETALMFKETDAKFKETDAQFKKTDKRIKEAFDLFTNQWGRLIESLVEGDLIKLLKSYNIKVEETYLRAKGSRGGEDFEFDIVAENTDEVVLTEVKTTLRPDEVVKFVQKMEKAKLFLPKYEHYRVYGAVAYLQEHSQAAKMAERAGLFVIKATGNSASIANAAGFRPKPWGDTKSDNS